MATKNQLLLNVAGVRKWGVGVVSPPRSFDFARCVWYPDYWRFLDSM